MATSGRNKLTGERYANSQICSLVIKSGLHLCHTHLFRLGGKETEGDSVDIFGRAGRASEGERVSESQREGGTS